jgi:hypothetical protein
MAPVSARWEARAGGKLGGGGRVVGCVGESRAGRGGAWMEAGGVGGERRISGVRGSSARVRRGSVAPAREDHDGRDLELREWAAAAEQARKQPRRRRRGPAAAAPGIPERASSPGGNADNEECDAVPVAALAAACPRHPPRAPACDARQGRPEAPRDPPATATRPSTQITPASGPAAASGVAESRGIYSVCHPDRSDNYRRCVAWEARRGHPAGGPATDALARTPAGARDPPHPVGLRASQAAGTAPLAVAISNRRTLPRSQPQPALHSHDYFDIHGYLAKSRVKPP